MTRLQRRAHDVHIAGTIEGIIAPAIRHINQPALDILPLLQLVGVHEIRGAEFLAPTFLLVVDVHHNNLLRSPRSSTLHHRQPDTPGAEHSDISPLLNALLPVSSRDSRSTVPSRNAAAEQTRAVHRRLIRDSDARDVGDDGVLGESGGAHEMQQVFALALEARRAVRHHAFALRGADFAAEVRFAGFAEFAFTAFGGAGCSR